MQRYWNNRFGCKLVYAFVVGILEEGPTLNQNAEPLVVEAVDLKLYGDIVLEEDVAYLNIKDNMDYGSIGVLQIVIHHQFVYQCIGVVIEQYSCIHITY